jgi:hypothetical protein
VRKCAQIIGVTLSDTMVETAMAKTSVTENSRKNRPHHAAHQQQRNEGGRQRQRDRQHGEADLARAAPRRLHRRQPRLHAAHDVLDHDDGVVDDKADGHGERHQRDIVDGKSGRPHGDGRARERQRNRDARRDGRHGAAQEGEDDDHHQRQRRDERHLHFGDAGAHRLRAVRQDRHVQARGHGRLQIGQHRLDAVHHRQHIGARLPRDDDDHRLLAVAPGGRARVAHATLCAGDIAQQHDSIGTPLDDEVAIIRRIEQLPVDGDRGAALVIFDLAHRPDGVGADDGVAQIGESEARRRQPRRIGAHADRRLLGAVDGNVADAVDLRQPLHQHRVGEIVKRARRQDV